MRHEALFTEFFFYIKPAVGEPQAQEGAEKAREMETGVRKRVGAPHSSSNLLLPRESNPSLPVPSQSH